MQQYQLTLSTVPQDSDADNADSDVLNVTGTPATLAAVLPALGIIIDVLVTAGLRPGSGVTEQVMPTTPAVETEEAKTKRTRRTKAEIEAAKAAEGHPAVQTEPAPELAPVAPAQRVNPFATPQA